MKQLSGKDLAGFIKERQVQQVRSLKQSLGIQPKLAIIKTVNHPAIEMYVRMKKRYGADIGIEVDIHDVAQKDVPKLLNKLNVDVAVQGIIVQLPLEDPAQTDEIVNLVDPRKDVDALGKNAVLDPATPLAILWLLAGYNINLAGKDIVLVGRGKLVGAPLERMLKASDLFVRVVDSSTPDVKAELLLADVIITATGSPGLITSDMIKEGAIVVDAGVAGEEGKTVGDLAPSVYERDDLTITPPKGGVGPLTICALFDNVLRVARSQEEKEG